ncbi:anti-sigma factor [Nocardia sp. NPDC049190]|uniref:anti-sigma factor n=1 Tax=Nocardia sp. NPDC049190 TaxID=3155650 RepID=UPI0033EEA94B
MIIRARAVDGASDADGVSDSANNQDMLFTPAANADEQNRPRGEDRTSVQSPADGSSDLDSTRIMPPLDRIDALGHTAILPPLELFEEDIPAAPEQFPVHDAPPIPRRRPWTTWIVTGAATAVAAALVLVAGLGLIDRDADGATASATEQVRRATDSVTRNGTVHADGATATAVLSHSVGKVVVSAVNLPALDDVHAYQLWMIPVGGAPRSAGILHTTGEYLELAADLPDDTALIAITTEPSDGSPRPTTPEVVRIDLA